MSLSDFNVKQVYPKALLCSGLFFSSLCDGASLVQNTLGTTSSSISTLTSTITITTTIAYRPSLIPGGLQYTLVGCYSQPSGDGERIFGSDEYDTNVDTVPPGEDTIEGCFRSCGWTAPLSNRPEHYLYAGLRNGRCVYYSFVAAELSNSDLISWQLTYCVSSVCICGVHLSTNAHKLSVDDCIRPCSGDSSISCGGQNNVIVYKFVSGDGMHTQTSQKGGSSSLMSSETKQPAPTSFLTTINTQGQGAVFQTAEALHHSGTSGKSVSTPTIAAIIGSLSGAIIIAAGLFLCYRVHKRKGRLRDTHVKSMLERRGRRSVPNLVLTQTNIPGSVIGLATTEFKRNYDRDSSSSSEMDDHAKDFRVTADGDLVPFTSAPTTGASSAVQWRPNNGNGTVFSAHQRAMSSSGIASPPASAKIDGLGERAWHRRKLSTPYRPATGAGRGLGFAAGASVGSIRGSIARGGPPSGPPRSLPPPLPKPGVRDRSQPGPLSKLIDTPDGPRSARETARNRSPARPRRSFDVITLEPEPRNSDRQDGSMTRVGMSHPNVSTPALGRYGSLSRPNRANSESPVLGWRTANGRIPGDAVPHDSRREDALAHRQPTIPVLPPVAPGERFDHKRWRGTIYAEPYETTENCWERGRQRSRGDEDSPVSASSTGTSILYSPREFDRRL
ncbi:hypothetical protein CIB48_g9651 [Xylaria polymorpha]|nr:hypothetical protein CIB48_g9651 [Xylaria polymorpha]